jgi:hypothetical protein
VAPVALDWAAEAEKYLSERGWRHVGTDGFGRGIWQDPLAADPRQKGEMKVGALLPNKEGEDTRVLQCFLPPAAWDCVTEQAVALQKARDDAGETAEQRIARKERELNELRRLAAAG